MGFTLVELLIGLMLAGVVGGAVVSLLREQSRFYRRHDDAVWAAQTARALTDLLAAEFRMASGRDLIIAKRDSVALRFDLWRAVVCDSTGPDEVVAFLYDSVTSANLPSAFRGTAASGPYDVAFAYADGLAPAALEIGSVPRAVCVAAGAPDMAPDRRYQRLAGWAAALGHAPEVGSVIRRYGRLSYRLGPAAVGGSFALWRNGQEWIAPFDTSIAFTYRLRDGSVLDSVPPARLWEVVALRVAGRAIGGDGGAATATRQVRLETTLRN